MKKEYVWSSEIFAYAVCPKKFRLKYMDKIDMPPTLEMVLGNLSHKAREALTKKEGRILVGIGKDHSLSEIEEEYKGYSDDICAYAISESARDLDKMGIEEQYAIDFVVRDLSLEFRVRSVRVFRIMDTLGIEKENLAEYMAPPWRYVEYKIMDKKLHMAGIVDRIERHAGSFYPVEIKTGKPPSEDVFWPQKIQLSCHAMLIENHFATPVMFGFVEYTQIAEKRPVMINEEIRRKVEEIRDNILSGTIDEEKTGSCHSCEFAGVCL